MNKNPYEIRLDVLKMAQEMLNERTRLESNNYSIAKGVDNWAQIPEPQIYTTEELLNKASELYSFVSSTYDSSHRTKK